MREQLEYIHGIYKGAADNFYVLLREGENNNAGLPSYVETIPFADFGKPLEKLIEELISFVDVSEKVQDLTVPDKVEPLEKEKSEIYFNVPFGSKGDAFVGREGLPEKIWNALNTKGRAAIGQAVSIEGFGGLGKTQLAVEFAHAYRDKYENGVFWVTADENIDTQLIKIGQDLKWISEFDKGFDHSELVQNRFRKLSNCLIIFDNVDEKHPIEEYLPEKHVHLLVTSREEQDGYYPININILSRDDARKLLLETAERSPSDAENAALEDILTELDGLPLAIELVGGYLKRRGSISFVDYLQFLRNEPLDRLEKRFPDKNFTGHDKSIIRTLKISEGLLKETRYLEDILDILAWSGTSSIGYSLLKELVGTTDDLALRDALGIALELHFIKKEEGAERYAIHRLLARVRQFEKPLRDRKEWHEKIVASLTNWFRKKDEEWKTLSEAEIEYDHLLAWQEGTLKLIPNKAVWLTLLKAFPLIERGNYKEAEYNLNDALKLYERENITDDLLLARLYEIFTGTHLALGNFLEARRFVEFAYKLKPVENSSNPTLSADILHIYGIVQCELGDYRRSLESQKQAFEMYRALFGEKHPNIANSLNDVGSIYAFLGETQKALEFREQALEMCRDLFGQTHPSIAISLNNVGLTYQILGELEKALELEMQALVMRRELFGEKHPDIASSLSNVGGTYGRLGKYKKALDFQKQALEMDQDLFGEIHPTIAGSLNNIGLTYTDLGEYKKALELGEQALAMYRQIFGEKHPYIATSLNNVGLSYGNLGQYERALELKERALNMYCELLGEKHPDIANSLNNVGGAYRDLGRHQEGLDLEAQALEMRRELFGEKHPDIASSLNDLGITNAYMGLREKALDLFGSGLEMRRELLGNGHPKTLSSAYNTVHTYLENGDPEKAGRLAAQFLAYIPPAHELRKFFETHGAPYRRVKKRHGKRR